MFAHCSNGYRLFFFSIPEFLNAFFIYECPNPCLLDPHRLLIIPRLEHKHPLEYLMLMSEIMYLWIHSLAQPLQIMQLLRFFVWIIWTRSIIHQRHQFFPQLFFLYYHKKYFPNINPRLVHVLAPVEQFDYVLTGGVTVGVEDGLEGEVGGDHVQGQDWEGVLGYGVDF